MKMHFLTTPYEIQDTLTIDQLRNLCRACADS